MHHVSCPWNCHIGRMPKGLSCREAISECTKSLVRCSGSSSVISGCSARKMSHRESDETKRKPSARCTWLSGPRYSPFTSMLVLGAIIAWYIAV